MRAALRIGAKDLRQRLRDRSAYVIAVLAPFGLAFILSSTLGSTDGEGFTFTFALLDADGGEVAAGFTALLDEVAAAGVAELIAVDTVADADRLVDDDEVSAAFVIPAGFSQAIEANQAAAITVIGNPEREIGTGVAQALAQGFAARLNTVRLSVGAAFVALEADFDPDQAAALAREAAEQPPAARLQPATAEGSGFDFTTYYAVGLSIFFLFFTVQFGVLSLIEERQAGTMTRLIAAPIAPWSIIVGKALGAFVLGLASMVVMVVSTTVLLGAEWGHPVGVVLLAVGGVLAAMGIVALVATLARTPEQASGYASIIAVVLGLLGGAFFPISIGPDLINRLSLLTPHRWLIDGFRDLSAGGTVVDILPALAAVLAFAVVTGAVGLARSRRLVRSQ